MKVSVIVCTYNRHGLLSASLASLIAQSFPKDMYEIVVVDNNSTYSTREVVEKLKVSSPIQIKYIFEKRQGLSFARNTGIEHALGEIIVFTDDDIEADKLWLKEMVTVFDKSDVVCAGGPIKPIWPFVKPEWLLEKWQVYLGVYEYEYASETCVLHGPSYPCGANIAFRRNIFDIVGMFSTDLGRIGNCLLSNEESRVCQKIEDLGKKICFARDALIYHKISPERLTKQWFYHRMYWQGRSDAILDDSTKKINNTKVATYLCKLASNKNDRYANFDTKCEKKLMQGYIHQYFILLAAGNTYKSLRSFHQILGLADITNYNICNKRDSERITNSSAMEVKIDWLLGKSTILCDINKALKELLKKIL